MMSFRRPIFALALAAGAALSGCAVYVPAEQTMTTTRSQQVVLPQGGSYTATEVQLPPAPAPIQEIVTVRPAVNMVWLPGVWFWGGSRYVWRPGRWTYPHAGYHHHHGYRAPHPIYRHAHPRAMRAYPGRWRR